MGDIKHTVIVCVHPGEEELTEAVWSKMLRSGNLLIRTVDPDEQITKLLADFVADEDVADNFVLTPATMIPCAPIDEDEIAVPYVYVSASGDRDFSARVPMAFSKSNLVQLFGEVPAGELDDAAFIQAYMDKFRTRPVEIGFKFGNFITPVLRSNPCRHVVMEALVRKKFISASPEGFEAIKELLEDALLK